MTNDVFFSQTEEFQKALALVKTMTAKGGNPVPADEDGLNSRRREEEMKF